MIAAAGFVVLQIVESGKPAEITLDTPLEEAGEGDGDILLEADSTYVVEHYLPWDPYVVTWGPTNLDPDLPQTRIEITLQDAVIEASVDYLCEGETKDLDGDGSDELIVWAYSGGAHCCSQYYIYTRHPAFRRIGSIYTGNGGLQFKDLDGDGVLEGVGNYDGLAYYDWSYAASPFPPIIFKWRDGGFVEETKAFPDLLRERLETYLYPQPADPNDPDYKEQRFPRVGAVLAYCILLDEEERAFALMKKLDPEMIPWMQEHREAIRALMAGMKERAG